jgi:hypothetical protein
MELLHINHLVNSVTEVIDEDYSPDDSEPGLVRRFIVRRTFIGLTRRFSFSQLIGDLMFREGIIQFVEKSQVKEEMKKPGLMLGLVS